MIKWGNFHIQCLLKGIFLFSILVAHKGFPKSQNVIDLMSELCRLRPGAALTRQDVDYNRDEIEKFLKRLKVKCEIPGQVESKRTYTINKLVKCPRDNYFEHQDKQVSVEMYYQIEKKYRIKYPDLPCLHVGPQQKNIHVPPEVIEKHNLYFYVLNIFSN